MAYKHFNHDVVLSPPGRWPAASLLLSRGILSASPDDTLRLSGRDPDGNRRPPCGRTINPHYSPLESSPWPPCGPPCWRPSGAYPRIMCGSHAAQRGAHYWPPTNAKSGAVGGGPSHSYPRLSLRRRRLVNYQVLRNARSNCTLFV